MSKSPAHIVDSHPGIAALDRKKDPRQIYLVNFGCASISVIENKAPDFKVRNINLPQGARPAGIAVAEDANFAFVADYGSGKANEPGLVRVFPINPQSGDLGDELMSIQVEGGPAAIKATTDGNLVFVTHPHAKKVSVLQRIDGEDRWTNGNHKELGTMPSCIVIDDARNKVYIYDDENQAKEVIALMRDASLTETSFDESDGFILHFAGAWSPPVC